MGEKSQHLNGLGESLEEQPLAYSDGSSGTLFYPLWVSNSPSATSPIPLFSTTLEGLEGVPLYTGEVTCYTHHSLERYNIVGCAIWRVATDGLHLDIDHAERKTPHEYMITAPDECPARGHHILAWLTLPRPLLTRGWSG